jgi:hypothetical protein
LPSSCLLCGDGELEGSQADRVIVNGANGNDTVSVAGDAGSVKASGLAATVESSGARRYRLDR